MEEVSVAGADGVFSIAIDGVLKVKEDSESGGGNATAFITAFFGSAGGDVTGAKVSERGVFTFEIIVAAIFVDIRGRFAAIADRGGVLF